MESSFEHVRLNFSVLMLMDARLRSDGYVLLRNAISSSQVERARRCMTKDLVHYGCMRSFIDYVMLPAVNAACKWNARYVKYRVSDNNNSSDASTFHRDVICLGDWQPVFTCLSYLDASVMELIPRSHVVLRTSVSEAVSLYPERIRIAMKPGDLLVFCATLLHRGIFTERVEHRRLIQVFDVYPNLGVYDVLSPATLHLPGDETYSDLMISASKNASLISILNAYGYLNASTGYGRTRSHDSFVRRCVPTGKHIISVEGLQGRVDVVDGAWQAINKYVHVSRHTLDSMNSACRKEFKHLFYNQQFIMYFVVTLLVVVTLLTATYYVIVCASYSTM